jgi:hypothetical protein
MVIAYVPAGVVDAVEIVRTEVKVGVPEGGVKVAVAPDGRPEADKLTVLLKPSIEVSETVALVDPPCTTDPDVGLTSIVKSGTGTEEVVKVLSADMFSFPAASTDFTL